MPLNSLTPHKMPNVFVETCWSPTVYYDDLYASTCSVTCAVKGDRHPHWNQQLLITNPPVHPDVGGYIFVSLTDTTVGQPFERFFIPVTFLKPYKPVHLEIHCRGGEYAAHPVLYATFCLEKPLESFVDSVSTITLHWADFDPLPYNCRQFQLIVTTDCYVPSGPPYIRVDLNDEQSLARAFQYQGQQSYS